MKKILHSLAQWFEAYGQARAATILTRNGKIQEAIKIMKR